MLAGACGLVPPQARLSSAAPAAAATGAHTRHGAGRGAITTSHLQGREEEPGMEPVKLPGAGSGVGVRAAGAASSRARLPLLNLQNVDSDTGVVRAMINFLPMG